MKELWIEINLQPARMMMMMMMMMELEVFDLRRCLSGRDGPFVSTCQFTKMWLAARRSIEIIRKQSAFWYRHRGQIHIDKIKAFKRQETWSGGNNRTKWMIECVSMILFSLTRCILYLIQSHLVWHHTHTYLSSYLVEGCGVVVSRRASIDKIFSFGAAALLSWVLGFGSFSGCFRFLCGNDAWKVCCPSSFVLHRRRRLCARRTKKNEKGQTQTENGGVIRTLVGALVVGWSV